MMSEDIAHVNSNKYSMFKKIISLTNLTLLVALSISTVAAYYSIIGLTAIFAGAVVPIIVMGSILEVGKITTTVWLRKYWNRASWVIKFYLVPAVVLLAFLTSMGIFGFLSKAHSDQNLVGGDVVAKLEIYDQKIQTAKDNVQSLRNELKQMDAAVDQVMARSTTEQGADKSNTIRKSQQKDRARIAKEIEANQKLIASLNDEAAPIRAEIRKVEAEVGPIKYIAAMIYGDNPDANLLEAAVRWVIILIVAVFDPLAIALVLAANASKEWDKEEPQDSAPVYVADVTMPDPEVIVQPVEQPESIDEPSIDEINTMLEEARVVEEPIEPEPIPAPTYVQGNYIVNEPKLRYSLNHAVIAEPNVESTQVEPPVVEEPVVEKVEKKRKPRKKKVTEIETTGITHEPYKILGDSGYVEFEGKRMHKRVLADMHPEFRLQVDGDYEPKINFGTKFPEEAFNGDMFVRVDAIPNRVFKFNGSRWIEVNKEQSDVHMGNSEYVQFLIDKIASGEYDVEHLSENERIILEEVLGKN